MPCFTQKSYQQRQKNKILCQPFLYFSNFKIYVIISLVKKLKIEINDNEVILYEAEYFNLDRTFTCGQAFRWVKDEYGFWQGIVKGKYLKAYQEGDTITLYTSKEDFYSVWYNYFDLGTNYEEICKLLSKDPVLNTALNFGKGIRVLNQEPFEALCSFIISQNNNIPRITGIIERLCENFGEKTPFGYAFPTPERIANSNLEELNILRSGFRAKYLLDAAKKVYSGEIDLEKIKEQDIDTARTELVKIYGVGKKVADCTMLFSMKKKEAFPEDVWIKRAVKVLFGGEFPRELDSVKGVAQQFLFYYARTTKLDI